MSQAQSPLEAQKERVLHLRSQGLGPDAISKHLRQEGVATSEKSIRRALKRWGAPPAPDQTSFKIDGDTVEITSKPSSKLISPEELLRERDLDPEEWEVTSLIVKEYSAMTSDKAFGHNQVVPMKYLSISCKRKKPASWVFPAQGPAPTYVRPKYTRPNPEGVKLVVFTGDQQAPYHDENLHRLFCEWLNYNHPEEGVLMGDTVDLPDISRHRQNPEWHVPVQECINSGYLILSDYVQASDLTEWVKLEGNHDERIRIRLLEYMTNLYGLRQADVPGQDPSAPAYSIRSLLRLDALGIALLPANGAYTHAQHKVSPYLAARHGWLAKKGSGTSALATLEHLGFSVLVGHTHRQSIVHKTTHDIDGKPYTLAAAETGCMCRIDEGLGYAVSPDWQNGFATAEVWPDGTFHIDLATYIDGKLYWRNQRYE